MVGINPFAKNRVQLPMTVVEVATPIRVKTMTKAELRRWRDDKPKTKRGRQLLRAKRLQLRRERHRIARGK